MTQHTALLSPAQERPRLLSDEPLAARVVIVVALLIGTYLKPPWQ
jgi:hypothetical protein